MSETSHLCSVCHHELSDRDFLTYRTRCEDCYCGGFVTPLGEPVRYIQTHGSGPLAFDLAVKFQRGRARNGQVVRSGRAHGGGM